MQRLETLCRQLGLALIVFATIMLVATHGNTRAMSAACYVVSAGLILVLGDRILSFAQSFGTLLGPDRIDILGVAGPNGRAIAVRQSWSPVRLVAIGLITVVATGIGGCFGTRVIDMYPAYQGVVMRKTIDPWSMFGRTSGFVDYIIVVRDTLGRESTHYLSDEGFSVRSGDSVVKARGIFEAPHFRRADP